MRPVRVVVGSRGRSLFATQNFRLPPLTFQIKTRRKWSRKAAVTVRAAVSIQVGESLQSSPVASGLLVADPSRTVSKECIPRFSSTVKMLVIIPNEKPFN